MCLPLPVFDIFDFNPVLENKQLWPQFSWHLSRIKTHPWSIARGFKLCIKIFSLAIGLIKHCDGKGRVLFMWGGGTVGSQ